MSANFLRTAYRINLRSSFRIPQDFQLQKKITAMRNSILFLNITQRMESYIICSNRGLTQHTSPGNLYFYGSAGSELPLYEQ